MAKINLQEIENFLNGKNPMQKIVSIECGYGDEKASIIYINEQGKEVTEYTMETEINNADVRTVDFRVRRDSAVRTMMIDACKRGWCEVSGKPEEMLIRAGATKIPAQQLLDAHVYSRKQLKICDDGYHYIRKIKGIECTKIALGSGFRG